MSKSTALFGTSSVVVWFSPKLVLAAAKAKDPLGNPALAWIQIIVSLGLILALAIFSIRFLARRSNVVTKGSIRVLAARQVAPNRSVQVIAVEQKKYLIGIGNEVTLLADITADYPEPSDPKSLGNDSEFSTLLAQTLSSVRERYQDTRRKGTGQ